MQAIGQNCNQLQSLNLGWCESITDKGVVCLASGCPNLRALDLCGCILITGTCIYFIISLHKLQPIFTLLALSEKQFLFFGEFA